MSKHFQSLKSQENLAETLYSWSKGSIDGKLQGKLENAINSYMMDSYNSGSEIIDNFSSTSDYDEITKEIAGLDKLLSVPDADVKWEKAFKNVNLADGKLKWGVVTHGGGPTFTAVAEGEPIKVYNTSGEIAYAKCTKYAAGIGWTDEILREREIAPIMDYLEMAKANYNSTVGNAHYKALKTAASSLSTSWVAGASTLERDIATLNKAASDISSVNKNKGYGDMSNPEILVYFQTGMKSRILTALNYVNQGQSTGEVVWNIKPLFTDYELDSTATTGIAVLPGRKLQRAVAQELALEKSRDASTQTTVFYYYAFLGAYVGDTEQTRTVEFA